MTANECYKEMFACEYRNFMIYCKWEGGKWIAYNWDIDRNKVHDLLMYDILNKKLIRCEYIDKITFDNKYDGTYIITVYQNNGYKTIYRIER